MEEFAITIPKQLENMQLPDPTLLGYYEDLENRIFWVDDEITEYSLAIIQRITNWNREDRNLPIEQRKPIKLLFFSPGGSLDVNYALIDVIRLSKTPVWGINMGRCCSAAAYIFLNCTQRFSLPHAYFVFHQGSGTLSGSYQEIVSSLQDYQEQVAELSEIMSEKTKYTEDEIAENIITEWYVRTSEALEKGVINAVVDDINIIL